MGALRCLALLLWLAARGLALPEAQADRLRLEAVRRQILTRLGLRHRPNVTQGVPRDVVLATLDRADAGGFAFAGNASRGAPAEGEAGDFEEFDDFYGRTSEIISFAEEGYRINQNRLLEFRISRELGHQAGQEFRIRTATLWLKAEKRHSPQPHQCRTTEIYVFKVVSRLTESLTLTSQAFDQLTSDPTTLTLHNASAPGWQQLDLTGALDAHLRDAHRADRLQLLVDCACCAHWRLHLLNAPLRHQAARPFLQVRTEPVSAKRVRRRALDCAPDSGSQCCKQRFYVSFRQLGWDDWVIAPQGYYANYCRGDCAHHRTPDTYVTYHTHVIEEARKTQHLSGMQPCCAPLKFSSMSLIYYGPDLTIIKRDLPKMVVDECGCP